MIVYMCLVGIGALVLIAILTVVWVDNSPAGYEDKDGFHRKPDA